MHQHAPSPLRRHGGRLQPQALVMLVMALLAMGGVMLFSPAAHASAATKSAQTLPDPKVQANSSMLINLTTGAVLWSDHADKELPMASTTKIMTAVVVLQHASLDQLVTIGPDAVAAVQCDCSKMGVSVGEVFTVRELLYGMLLPSGIDAAVALADAVAGDTTTFVDMMNAQAQALGMTETHYVNVHGLDDKPEHFSSARDIITLTTYAKQFSAFQQVVATHEQVIPATDQHKAYDLFNTNLLLGTYPGADGVKTGTTGHAGHCLVFSATRGSTRLLGVELGAPTDDARYQDARNLLDWGFAIVGGQS